MNASKLPQDLNAEAAVLYSVLHSQERFLEVKQVLEPQDMFSEAHKAILAAAIALHESGSPLDVVTIGSKLDSHGKLELAGGMDYLERLLDYEAVVTSTANTKYYAKIVKEKSLLRQTIALCQRTAARGHSDIDFSTLSADLARQLVHLRESCIDLSRPIFVDAKTASMNSLKGHAAKMRGHQSLRTGLNALDAKMRGGNHNGEFTIIAARPSMGKSSLMTCQSISLSRFGLVLIFSLEMPEWQIADRILCHLSGLSSEELVDVRLEERAIQVQDAIHRVSPNILINDWIKDPIEMISWAREKQAEAAKDGVKVAGIFIDHLGIAEHPHAARDDISFGKTTKMLKNSAKDLNVPITALHQLNRSVEMRDNKRPMISDLRESGRIEEDADNILLLYRDSYYKAKAAGEDEEPENEAELIIGKQRNGERCSVKALFHGPSTTFKDLPESRSLPEYEPFKF